MKRLAYITMMAVLVVLTGCNEDKPAQTVDWYKERATERASVLTDCRANAGQVGASANCINAEKADAQLETAKRGHLQLDAGEFAKTLKEKK